MDAKTKAQELINKFLRVKDNTLFYWEPYYDRRYMDDEVKEHAIKCAKIVVSEIIKLENFSIEGREFWNKVKTELDAPLTESHRETQAQVCKNVIHHNCKHFDIIGCIGCNIKKFEAK